MRNFQGLLVRRLISPAILEVFSIARAMWSRQRAITAGPIDRADCALGNRARATRGH